MPIITVKISHPPAPRLVRDISETVLDLTTRILHKKREVTAITVESVPRAQWIIAGETLAARGLDSFYLDIKVVSGTNTREELAAYVEATFAAFRKLLGELHPESYVFVHEVSGDAYGYGGLTQNARRWLPTCEPNIS